MEIAFDRKILVGAADEIRITVSKDWTVEDMIKLYSSLQNLYDYYCLRDVILVNTSKGKHNENAVIGFAFIISKLLKQQTTLFELQRTYHIIDFSIQGINTYQIYSPLTVERIQISSPGFMDLAGLGTAIGHIKELFLKLREQYFYRNRRDIEDEKLKLENDLLKIKKTSEFIKLLKEAGFDQNDIKKIVSNEYENSQILLKLIEEDKVDEII